MQINLSRQFQTIALASRRCVMQLMIIIVGIVPAFAANTQVPAAAKLLQLTKEATEALDNGVRLEFVCRYGTRSALPFLSYRNVHHRHKFEIQRHALSNRYVVRKDDLETPRIFRSAPQAMNYIADQARLLLDNYQQDSLALQMRISLNQYSLPGPMRLNAFLSEQWDIDSGWVQKTP